METRRLSIREVCRPHPIATVSPTDFVTEGGSAIDPEEVLRSPRFSLYCFDLEHRAAMFTESNDSTAVDQAPFYYQGQVEHAIGLVTMPLDVFHRMAETIPLPPKGFVFVHSTGRCGSTLISKVLAAVPSVHSLSEPDDLTQLVRFRVSGGVAGEEIRRLAANSVKWRAKPREGEPAERVAIKTRSEVMVLADLIGPAFRDEKHFFLYRNAISWMATLFRGWPLERDVYDAELNRRMADNWGNMLALVREYWSEESPLNPVQIRVLAWVACMEAYLDMRELGVPVAAARFEDLTANALEVVQSFLAYCGIESPGVEVLQEVLSRDSQAGTIYDREERKKLTRELTPELIEAIRLLLSGRPRLRLPDIVLAGTIGAGT